MGKCLIRIPFKVWLGSEKDIEDAAHLNILINSVIKSANQDAGLCLRVKKAATR